jgi:hypothetical protein
VGGRLNACRVFVGEHDKNRAFGRTKGRGEDDIEIIIIIIIMNKQDKKRVD